MCQKAEARSLSCSQAVSLFINLLTCPHKSSDLRDLARYLGSLIGETRVKCLSMDVITSRSVMLIQAGLFVSQRLIHTPDPKLRKQHAPQGQTDSADAKEIARYTHDNWVSLREYSVMDTTRTERETLNSTVCLLHEAENRCRANLIALLDMTYPGVNKLFTSPVRPDGSEK